MKPMWRHVFDRLEQTVAPRLEEVTASGTFRDLLGSLVRINGAMTAETERLSRQWLHLWNLPAAGDVRSLRRQVASLERELKALRHALDTEATPEGDLVRLSVVDRSEDAAPAAAAGAGS